MKKLWLSAFAAACLLAGTAAHAGDHYRDRDYDRGWHEHRDYRDRDCDDRGRRWDRPHGWGSRVYYRPAPVYYSPVIYYPARPVYYEPRGYRHYDDDVHGSISVSF